MIYEIIEDEEENVLNISQELDNLFNEEINND